MKKKLIIECCADCAHHVKDTYTEARWCTQDADENIVSGDAVYDSGYIKIEDCVHIYSEFPEWCPLEEVTDESD